MADITALDLESEVVETMPRRELMTSCGCGCSNNTNQIGLVNIDDSVFVVDLGLPV